MKVFFITLFSILQSHLLGQQDTLNQYNSKGKKQGYWICYLDEKFNISDSITGKYIGFSLFDNGEDLTLIGKRNTIKYNTCKDSIIPKNDFFINKIKLNGQLKFYNNEGELIYKEEYSNGHLVMVKSYYHGKNREFCKGEIFELINFKINYENQLGSYYYESHPCQYGKITKFWFRKGKHKWKFYKIKSQ